MNDTIDQIILNRNRIKGFSAFLGENALSIELNNISPLDALHQLVGVIE
ncbi:hypothetical protein [Paenibacillus farraposensis]|nr:hypothetical protein [Paenibacillus farraposensis]